MYFEVEYHQAFSAILEAMVDPIFHRLKKFIEEHRGTTLRMTLS
jgi:hypothetical protein